MATIETRFQVWSYQPTGKLYHGSYKTRQFALGVVQQIGLLPRCRAWTVEVSR